MVKKIVIFGGTFDPPHIEHINMAKACDDELSPDLFIVIPTFEPPHKRTLFCASPTDRIEMCRLSFCGMKNVVISDYEIQNEGKSYTYLTVEHFAEVYPCADIYFLLGTDMLTSFDKWKFPDRILKKVKLVLCLRDGENISADEAISEFHRKFPDEITKISYIGKDMSSTEYKTSRMLGLDTSHMTSPEVNEYVIKNNVYPADKYFKFISENLKPSRVFHTEGVILASLAFAKKLGVDSYKTLLAALLHDCAKYLDYRDFDGFKLPENVPQPVIHQYLGEYVAREILGVTDNEVLNAIRYHTTGRPKMTKLEKIIFCADMVERSRDYPELEFLRQSLRENFEQGFYECLKASVDFVKASGNQVFDLSLKALSYYKNIMEV